MHLFAKCPFWRCVKPTRTYLHDGHSITTKNRGTQPISLPTCEGMNDSSLPRRGDQAAYTGAHMLVKEKHAPQNAGGHVLQLVFWGDLHFLQSVYFQLLINNCATLKVFTFLNEKLNTVTQSINQLTLYIRIYTFISIKKHAHARFMECAATGLTPHLLPLSGVSKETHCG